MTVSELIAELRKCPKDAQVVAGYRLVQGVVMSKGRLRPGYLDDNFVRVAENKSRDTVAELCVFVENSDGVVRLGSVL